MAPSERSVSVSKNGTDLFDLSQERAAYRGHIVDHIDAGNGYVAFTNGLTTLYRANPRWPYR